MRILVVAALSLFPALASAQAWPQEAGTAFVRLSLGLASADTRYDHTGARVPYDARLAEARGTPFRDRSVYVYGEYGLRPELSLYGSIPYRRLVVQDPRGGEIIDRQSVDLGTATLGFRLGLAERVGLGERSALALNLGLRLPLGYQRNLLPAVGSGQVDAEALLSAGHRFAAVPAYAQLGAGYRHRTGIFGLSRRAACPPAPPAGSEPLCIESDFDEAYSDQLLGRAEIGYTLFGRVLVQALGDLIWSVERPRPVRAVEGMIQPEGLPRQRYARAGGGLAFRLSGATALSVHAFGVPYGRQAVRSTEIVVGLQTQW